MRARIGTAAATRILLAGAFASWAAGLALLSAAGFAPAKDDIVYVAAKLQKIRHRQPMSNAKLTYDMAACEKLVVKKANVKKGDFTVVDLMGNDVRLEGTWTPWMFRTQEECRIAVAKRGEAPVKKAGEIFTLSTQPPPAAK